MRSITAGLLAASAAANLDEVEDACVGASRRGLNGASVLPSTLMASSRLGRLDILSPVERLSRLVFPERLSVGGPSSGLLMLLLPVILPPSSSPRAVMLRAASLSMTPFAANDAIVGLAGEADAQSLGKHKSR